MRFSFLITILYFIFFNIPSQTNANLATGNVKVESCNCTKCCYVPNSQMILQIDADYDPSSPYTLWLMNGKTMGNGNCSIYINSSQEQCSQTNENQIGSLLTRSLSCNLSNSLIGSALLIGDVSDKSQFAITWTQAGEQCYLILKYSSKMSFTLFIIIIMSLLFLDL